MLLNYSFTSTKSSKQTTYFSIDPFCLQKRPDTYGRLSNCQQVETDSVTTEFTPPVCKRNKWKWVLATSCICARTYLQVHVTSKRNRFGWSRSLVAWSSGAVRATQVSAWSLAARYSFRVKLQAKSRSESFFQKACLCTGRHIEAFVTNANGILRACTTLLQQNAFCCLLC